MLSEVECTGQELYVTDCPSSGYYQHNCDHSHDVGVRCSGEVARVDFIIKPSSRMHSEGCNTLCLSVCLSTSDSGTTEYEATNEQ